MTLYDGDLSAQVARQLQREHVEKILADGEDLIDVESPMMRDTRKSIFSKIEFKWRASDEKIIEQIRVGVDQLMRNLYADMKIVVDNFYAETRKPEVNSETGVVRLDGGGRVIWQKDANGKEIEDWSQLTGQDIEKTLFDISRLKLDLAPRVNHLLGEAVFAKHTADDSFQDSYAELVEGTIGDRNAHAARKSREDKYGAYFRWMLWSEASVFLKEVDNFSRLLERVLQFRVSASYRER